jgi:sulfite oxidase
MDVRPIAGELGWGADAIGHAEWSGVRLRDVLLQAGFDPGLAGSHHVALGGLDETERLGRRLTFGGSIPLSKALSPEVLLAHSMNGQPLPSAHGFPLRVIVPGYIGARSVKWLQRIVLQPQPSDNYFQARAYRLFPPDVSADTVVWEAGLALAETTLTSVICSPCEAEPVVAGRLTVRGYALAGGSCHLARVELSTDGGQTWAEAELLGAAEAWSWRIWQAHVELPAGPRTLVVRAVDDAGHTQPPDPLPIWNFKGYMNNAWHRVNIEVVS